MKSLIFGRVTEDNFHSDIVGAMAPGEEILCRVEQPRLLKSLFNPASMYITSSRIIRRDSRLFGLISFCIDYPLGGEILSCTVEHGLFFSSFRATFRFSNESIFISKIPKKGAMLLQQKVRHPFSYRHVEYAVDDSDPDMIIEALRCKLKKKVAKV